MGVSGCVRKTVVGGEDGGTTAKATEGRRLGGWRADASVYAMSEGRLGGGWGGWGGGGGGVL